MLAIEELILYTYKNLTLEIFIREFRGENDISKFYCFDELSNPLVASNKINIISVIEYKEYSPPEFHNKTFNVLTTAPNGLGKNDYTDDLIFTRFNVVFEVCKYGKSIFSFQPNISVL